MRTKLILTAAFTSMAFFSSMAFAGGANCDAHKGHKDMSAEAWQELKDSHPWMFSHGEKDMDKSSSQIEKPSEPAPQKNSSNLVEI